MYYHIMLFDTTGAYCVRQFFIIQKHSSSVMPQNSNKKEQISILFVDDDKEFLKSAKRCLSLQGKFSIKAAFSVDEALEKMKKKKPDAIVCDILMPLTDGFEFLKALRESGNNIPFIVFTVAEDKETALEAFNLGANGFVGKSGDPEIVFSTLQRCIEKAISSQ
jgi:CheY-like chemotaxis protein